MADAKRPRTHVPGWDKKVRGEQMLRSLRSKTFEELSVDEKDFLLKIVATRLNLVKGED